VSHSDSGMTRPSIFSLIKNINKVMSFRTAQIGHLKANMF